MTLAGLAATLEAYRDGRAVEASPALAMLHTPAAELKRRAERLRDRLRRRLDRGWALAVVRVMSRVGAGALPTAELPSWAVAIEHPELGADAIEARLRATDPAVIGRITDDRLMLDVRTIRDAALTEAAEAVRRGLERA
jgi:L-seryl-tRNA(Ser) seleniumtransferase